MNNVKKCLFTFGFVLILVAVCSLSAFAVDYNFTLSNYPMCDNTYTNDNSRQAISFFVQNPSGDVYYCVFLQTVDTRTWVYDTSAFLTAGSLYYNNSNWLFLPMTTFNIPKPSGYWRDIGGMAWVYDVDGNLVYGTAAGSWVAGSQMNDMSNSYFSGITSVNDVITYLSMPSPDSYFVVTSPNGYISANDIILNNLSSCFGNGINFGQVEYVIPYHDVDNPTQLGTCSIEGSIYVNGNLIFSSDSSGSGSVISGSASGSVPDGQGGSQDVNFDINLDLPEYDGDIGTDEFPTMPEFDDSALSVIDGGSALQWVYARVNDLVTTNQKIFALVTSCLSLGVIMLILNKRS